LIDPEQSDTNPTMPPEKSITKLRVRYSETDQMGTFYNSRALEWFEVGRTDWLRQAGIPYAEMELRGALLPLVEAHVQYHGRARYDDELELITTAQMAGKASMRFEIAIAHVSGDRVASGYTLHAIVNAEGKPIRPPAWLSEAMA
jgi:acyl-CoA thioester hydrolase